jgi:phosphate transport system substrate-binding protein
MRVNWRLLASLVAILALFATACGGDDGESAGDEATEAAGAAEAAETEAEDEASEMTSPAAGGGEDLSGTLNGAGASSQAAAMQAWVAGFQEQNPEVTVNYDPVGSGGGREQFLSGGVTFAGSDEFLSEEELTQAQDRCAGDSGAVDLPHYVSPIAVAYNLPDVGVENLNLTPDAIAGIFSGQVTNWTDDAIASENPDANLPDQAINPVHRSDDSGTTANFTDYLAQAAPDVWDVGSIETWPTEFGGEGAQGTSGVVQAVTAGEGSIGYADASQVQDLGTAAVQVGEEFVSFSPEAAARVLDISELAEDRPEGDFAINLARDTTESGVYPIVLISYHIVCQEYEDEQEATLVRNFMQYISSEEGQMAAAEAAGSAPISQELRDRMAPVIEGISVAG